MMNIKPFHSRVFSLLFVEWLWLVLLLPALCLWLSSTSSIRLVDNFVYDRLISSHSQPVDKNIVLIDIDERSLNQIGAWPWPRTTHAQLLNTLNQASPKSVLFDVIFTEPGPNPAHDQALADALKKIEHVALPVMLLPKNALSISEESEFNVKMPIPVLAKSAHLGHIMAQPDSDNVLRQLYLSLKTPQLEYLSLSQQAALLTSPQHEKINIPFIAPTGSYASVSYVDVLNNKVPDELFQNRYVLIGARAAGLGDSYSTPFGQMSGVEIQATVLDGLINQRSIRTLPFPLEPIVLIVPIILLLLGFIRLNERHHLTLLVCLLLVHAMLIAISLWWRGIWIPPVATWNVLLLTYIVWSWRRLSAAMRYFDGEIRLIAQSPNQLRSLLMHLSPTSTAATMKTTPKRSLETLIKQVGDLQHFITYSLLQAQPMPMLVFSDEGEIILSNQKSQGIINETLDTQSIQSFFARLDESSPTWAQWHEESNYLWLDGVEVKSQVDGQTIYKIQVTPVKMDSSNEMWLLGFVDLTQERETQRQNAELVQFLSHDLRTPLVNVLALLQLHAEDAVEISKASMMTKIDQSIHRALTLAENLVFLSHAKAGSYCLMELNLAHIAPQAVELVSAQAQQKNIRLILKPVSTELSERCWVNIDGDLIERALINVLTNAIRYSPENREVTIEINEVDDTHVSCDITDQGIGMVESQIQKLMDGQRLVANPDYTDIDAAGSMGIGFSMIRIIMQRHGGWVKISSKLGQGTKISLVFPRLD